MGGTWIPREKKVYPEPNWSAGVKVGRIQDSTAANLAPSRLKGGHGWGGWVEQTRGGRG